MLEAMLCFMIKILHYGIGSGIILLQCCCTKDAVLLMIRSMHDVHSILISTGQ